MLTESLWLSPDGERSVGIQRLVGPGARSRLVVLGVEVGGKWLKRLAPWALWHGPNKVAQCL